MSSYAVTIAVTTDPHLTDEQARDVAARWAAGGGFDLGLTSTRADLPWLAVSGMTRADNQDDPAHIVTSATDTLAAELRTIGADVTTWESVEVLGSDVIAQRSRNMGVPPMVSAKELADMCQVSSNRIYELEGERKAAADRGERHAFPAPVVPGYWLETVAKHYAATRKRKPGPQARPA